MLLMLMIWLLKVMQWLLALILLILALCINTALGRQGDYILFFVLIHCMHFIARLVIAFI